MLLFLLTVVAKRLYFTLTPGVPDAGVAPVALVPWLFSVYESAGLSIFTDFNIFLVWASCCLAYLIPAFAAGFFVSSRNIAFCYLTAVLAILGFDLYRMYQFRLAFTLGEPTSWKYLLGIFGKALSWVDNGVRHS